MASANRSAMDVMRQWFIDLATDGTGLEVAQEEFRVQGGQLVKVGIVFQKGEGRVMGASEALAAFSEAHAQYRSACAQEAQAQATAASATAALMEATAQKNMADTNAEVALGVLLEELAKIGITPPTPQLPEL